MLLPAIDGVDTAEQQVSIAMSKGGITTEDEIVLQRFKVTKVEE